MDTCAATIIIVVHWCKIIHDKFACAFGSVEAYATFLQLAYDGAALTSVKVTSA
jgi:hypothetical protein